MIAPHTVRATGALRRLLVLVMLAAGGFAPAAQAQMDAAVRYFDDGNRLFSEGRYEQAEQAYRKALDTGYESAALLHNLGNVYYRLDRLGESILYYEKARLHAPDDPALLHSLRVARERTVDRFSTVPEAFWKPAWRGFVRTAGLGTLTVAGLLAYLVAMTLLILRILGRAPHAWQRRLSTGLLAGGLLLTLGALSTSRARAISDRAVVIAGSADLTESPKTDAERLLEVHAGLVVDVVERAESAVRVRLSNGTVGWLPADVVGVI